MGKFANLILLFVAFGHFSFATEAKNSLAKIIDLTLTRPGSELLAYGKASRDERKFDEALTYFQAALSSSAGRKEFDYKLLSLFYKIDTEMEDFFGKSYKLTGFEPRRGDEKSVLRDGLFRLTPLALEDDKITGKQRLKLTVDFRGLKIDPDNDKNLKKMSSSETDKLILIFMEQLAKGIGETFVGNPLVLKVSKPDFILEGFFNTDFPYTITRAYREIADTYYVQGDYTLSLKYFNILTTREDLLVSKDEKIDIAYKKVDMLSVISAEKVEKELMKISDMDKQFDKPIFEQVDTAKDAKQVPRMIAKIVETIEKNGIDKALLNFRVEDNFAHRAHVQIGLMNYKSGRFEGAIKHLSYATFQGLIRVFREIRQEDPNFEMTDLASLLERAIEDPELVKYLKESYTFQSLYYLGLTLEKRSSQKIIPRQIFEVLAKIEEAGNYQKLSKQRL